jgi:hypothetical protein
MKFLLVSLLVIQFSSSQTFTLSGAVRDAITGEPLSAATVRLIGTARGTIANSNGLYSVQLEKNQYTVAFSFIGYRTDTLQVTLDQNREVNVSLAPSAIQLAEVVVSGEDPAIGIMRNVIENKRRWIDGIKNYQFDAFARWVMRRDTAIASIMESYSSGYWRKGDTLREVIKQKRQTENIPGAQNFSQVGGIANFYQDTIRLMGFQFLGPTAVDAFDYYNFKLERTRQMSGSNVYEIRMIPKSRLRPLFAGRITILEDRYAVIGIDVTPNEAFNIPMVSDLQIHYKQQFALFLGRFWMPVDIRTNGSIQIGITGINFPKFGFESVTAITDYKLNGEIPDTLFQKRRRIELPEAKKTDSIFWAQNEGVPLTVEEKTAYQKLDSTQTLDKQFKPSGPLMVIGEASDTPLKYLDARFNRVEGLFLGGTAEHDSLVKRIKLFGGLGRGLSDARYKWNFGAEYFLDSTRKYSLGVEVFDNLSNIPDENLFTSLSVGLTSLLAKEDYRDYFYSRGIRVFATARVARRVRVRAEATSELTESAVKTTDYSFFYRDVPYRPNIPIQNGTIASLSLKARYGQEAPPLGIIHVDGAEAELQHANSGFGSDFDFTRLLVRADYRIVTSLSSLFLPPSLQFKFVGGISTGSLPIQRMFALDSRYASFEMAGALKGANVREFGGDQFFLLLVEHNFRNIPWLALDIPFLYKNSIELLAFGTLARSWMTNNSYLPFTNTTDGVYAEAGIGVSRIFALLRLNFTYRFAQPQQFVFSVSIAQLL